ncbi:unnamed protein product [Aphanomyces euteiches]|uniref:Uncharacterized protein n=1 Tax=Aphanomyces euteiches TaxID=100861 RepID=A0A6G0X6L8_9STRA|nr:hypothetical protein Ae201684_007950 [Aphanomyces euteiches]KAH9074484.1 hypothetical protein Ae201684P_022291 [Aphanomyces euteiches]
MWFAVSFLSLFGGTATALSWELHDYRLLLGQANANQCPSWNGFDYAIVAPSGACLPYSIFNNTYWAPTATVGHVPYPRSSYRYTLDKPLFPNGGLSPTSSLLKNGQGVKFPRVTIVTSISTIADSVNVFRILSPEIDYNWQDFQTNRDAFVWTQLQPADITPGVYQVDLDAWDYVRNSGVCSLFFTVTDNHRPRSTSVCPDSSLVNLNQSGWNANVGTLNNYLAQVKNFKTTRTNNECSSVQNATCTDTVKLSGTDWFQCPLNLLDTDSPATALQIDVASCVTDKLTVNPFANASKLASPGDFLSPEQCTRSVSFDYKWFEYWVSYSRTDPSVSHCTSGADNVGSGDLTGAAPNEFACAAGLSLAATADDLVQAVKVFENSTLFNHSNYIGDPNGTFPDMGYSNVSQIHFWSPATIREIARWDEFAPIIFNIQDLFTTRASGGGIANLTLPTGDATTFWRWRQDNGPWKDYAANDQLVLSKLATEITFEAWTHCGAKAQNIVWTVYNHRHQSIKNLDEWFVASWSFDGDANCNIRQSDFTALHIHFDLSKLNALVVDATNNVANSTALLADEMPTAVTLLDESDQIRWIFNEMKCTWKYGNMTNTDYTPSSSSWTILSSQLVNGLIDATFAPKLLNDPVTTLTVLCDLSFTDSLSLTGLVLLYSGDFNGPSQAFGLGTYNLEEPFYKDVGSIKVQTGFEVVLFDQRDGQGNSMTFRFDASGRDLTEWSHLAQSIIVRECTLVLVLLSDAFYSGTETPLGVGDANLDDPNFLSFRLLSGYQVTLYDDLNQQGNHITLSSSTEWLGKYSWHGARSVRVEPIGNTIATLWEGTFVGEASSYGVGHYNLQGALLNSVSSITIAPGYQITLYDQLNQQGSSIKYVQNVAISGAWDNKAKSIDIEAIPNSFAAKTTNVAHIYESSTFWFENCDLLTWEGGDDIYADESCLNSCAADSWKLFVDRVAGPFQACAGHLIYPDSDWAPDTSSSIGTVLDLRANHTCCAGCDGTNGFANSQTAVCTPTVASSAISRCQPSQYDLVKEAAAERATPINPGPNMAFLKVNSSFLSGIAVLVAIVFVGVVHKSMASRRIDMDSDAYMPLTDMAL